MGWRIGVGLLDVLGSRRCRVLVEMKCSWNQPVQDVKGECVSEIRNASVCRNSRINGSTIFGSGGSRQTEAGRDCLRESTRGVLPDLCR